MKPATMGGCATGSGGGDEISFLRPGGGGGGPLRRFLRPGGGGGGAVGRFLRPGGGGGADGRLVRMTSDPSADFGRFPVPRASASEVFSTGSVRSCFTAQPPARSSMRSIVASPTLRPRERSLAITSITSEPGTLAQRRKYAAWLYRALSCKLSWLSGRQL